MPSVSDAERRRLKKVLATQIPFPFDIDPFLDRAIRQFPEDPASFAYSLIIQSRPFRRRFPGIFRPDGTLRVTPAEYVNREEQFRSIAAQYGFKLRRSAIGGLVSNDVDPQEFTIRARGIQQARTNQPLMGFLNKQIREINRRRAASADGESFDRIPLIRSRKDAVDFFTGRADREVYAVYEGALFREAARGSRRGGLALSAKQARRLANRTEGVLDEEDIEQGFANIAARLKFASAELKQAGISQKDLQILEFGGPGRARIRERAERILKQREAQLSSDPAQRRLQLEEGAPVVEGTSI